MCNRDTITLETDHRRMNLRASVIATRDTDTRNVSESHTHARTLTRHFIVCMPCAMYSTVGAARMGAPPRHLALYRFIECTCVIEPSLYTCCCCLSHTLQLPA